MQERHGSGTNLTHVRLMSIATVIVFNLDASRPVIGCNGRETFHYITFGKYAAIDMMVELRTARFGLQDAVADGAFGWSSRPWSIIVVDEVELSRVVAAIGCAMYPVIDYIVDEVEDAVPTNRRITSAVRSPQVTDECCILAAQCRTESMIVGVERLRRNGVLNGHVHRRILIGRSLVLSLRFVIHVAIERNVLVQSPLARAVVDHDVAHGIAAERILAMLYTRFSTTETHVTNDDIVCIDGKRFSCNADTIARGCLSGYSDIWSSNIDGRFQSDDTSNVEDYNSRTTGLTSLAE